MKPADRRRFEIKKFSESLKTGGCVVCGEEHVACLVWHHKNPEDKEFTMEKIYSMGLEKAREALTSETKKCVLLCSNCHYKLHYRASNHV